MMALVLIVAKCHYDIGNVVEQRTAEEKGKHSHGNSLEPAVDAQIRIKNSRYMSLLTVRIARNLANLSPNPCLARISKLKTDKSAAWHHGLPVGQSTVGPPNWRTKTMAKTYKAATKSTNVENTDLARLRNQVNGRILTIC